MEGSSFGWLLPIPWDFCSFHPPGRTQDPLGKGAGTVRCWDLGSLDGSKGTYSVSLHSRKASCSRQSPSTLERKEKEEKGRAFRRCHGGPSSQAKPTCSEVHGQPRIPAHLRSRRSTLTRTTRLSSFTLKGREKAIMPLPPPPSVG